MKKEYFVIDMHSHVADPEIPFRIQEKAEKSLSVRKAFEGIQRLQQDVGCHEGMIGLNPVPDNFIRVMDESGTDVAVLSMLGFTEELDGIEISSSDYLTGVINNEKYKGKFYGFAGVDPRYEDADKRIEYYVKQKGFIGAKLNPNDWGTFPLNSPMLEPIFGKCEELGIPLHIHTGVDPSGSIENANPILLDNVAHRYPNLTILLEHYGFPYKYEAYAMCRKHDNVFLTLAWHFNKLVYHNKLLAWLEIEEMRIHAGIDKIVYGSDYPATPNNKQVIDFLKYERMPLLLKLSGVKEWTYEMRLKVLGLNAAHLLKLKDPKLEAIERKFKSNSSNAGISMDWSPESLKTLDRIPSFIRNQAIAKIENYARTNNIKQITPDIMEKARKS